MHIAYPGAVPLKQPYLNRELNDVSMLAKIITGGKSVLGQGRAGAKALRQKYIECACGISRDNLAKARNMESDRK